MRVYLDNNATTQIDPKALEAMIEELSAPPRNPSSIHSFGQKGKKVLSKCREQIGKFLGVKPNHIFFTSGGTEGINLLIRGAFQTPHAHIIGSSIDHASILYTLKDLEGCGAKLTLLPSDPYGAPSPEALQKALCPQTKLIVLSAANGETGVKTDLEKMGAIAKSAGIPLIIDGVALIGKEPLTIPDGVCGIAFSAHKFHGPKGVGFIYLHPSLKLKPIMTGGGQEKKLRSGTENLPGIVGMTQALSLIDEKNNQKVLQSLRTLFESELAAALPDIEINGEGPRLSNTSNIYFPGVDGESLLIALDMEGIAASYASACTSGALKASHVLSNMGYSRERVSSSIRFSFSRFNTPEEVRYATKTIVSLVMKMRAAATIC
ncbi:MAG: cysteine desulfurase [Chlamydiia bacterium]|nr:cysteine desulfurase [Chlamydiia bacterium]